MVQFSNYLNDYYSYDHTKYNGNVKHKRDYSPNCFPLENMLSDNSFLAEQLLEIITNLIIDTGSDPILLTKLEQNNQEAINEELYITIFHLINRTRFQSRCLAMHAKQR